MSARMLMYLAAIAVLVTPCRAAAQVVATYQSGITSPWGVEFDPAGNLYVSGRIGDAGFVRRIPADGGPATTISGGMNFPTGMAIAPSGDLFIADTGGSGPGQIWKVTPAGVKTLVVRGGGLGNLAFMEFDAAGNLIVSDRNSGTIWIVSPNGDFDPYIYPVSEPGELVGQFVVEPSGDIYIGIGQYIKRIGPGGSSLTIVASGLGSVQGLVRGPEGDFIITRNGSSELWRVSPGGVATPWAGSTSGCVDGDLANAKLGSPQGLATFESRLFIADRTCNSVRVIETPTPVQETSWGRVKSTYR